MLSKIKLLLGITDSSKDVLLEALIDKATQYIKDVTHRTTLTSSLECIAIDCVIYDYNRLGTAGLVSESYSGISYSYLADYPENILRQIRSQRKIGVL